MVYHKRKTGWNGRLYVNGMYSQNLARISMQNFSVCDINPNITEHEQCLYWIPKVKDGITLATSVSIVKVLNTLSHLKSSYSIAKYRSWSQNYTTVFNSL